MPEYPFRNPDGATVYRFFSMNEAPTIGDTVDIDGVPCVRLASDCVVNGDPLSGRYPHESYQISHADAKQAGLKFSDRGVPVFQNAKQERSFASRFGYAFD